MAVGLAFFDAKFLDLRQIRSVNGELELRLVNRLAGRTMELSCRFLEAKRVLGA
jgi:hypothetical protein